MSTTSTSTREDREREQEEAYEAYCAHYQAQEEAYRATLTPTQLRDYLVHAGELEDHCPKCGERYVEATTEEFPDYVGENIVTTYPCCGYVASFCTGLEYDSRGRVVDVR